MILPAFNIFLYLTQFNMNYYPFRKSIAAIGSIYTDCLQMKTYVFLLLVVYNIIIYISFDLIEAKWQRSNCICN